MSRVVSLAHPRAHPVAVLASALGLLLASIGAAAAQDVADCGDERSWDCRLPDWSEAAQRDVPSLFGDIDGTVWVEDARGDAPPGGLDILAVGVGRVEIEDAQAIRSSSELRKLGKAKKAVKAGPGVVVRIVLDRAPDAIESGHAGIHVATDIDGSRSNNAPTGVGSAANPFAGSQDVYSLTYATTTGKTKLLDSDLARGWYADRDFYAASWSAPDVLDMLIRPTDFGDSLRVITFVGGDEAAYDSLAFGTGAIPVDGRIGLLPTCVEGAVSNEPFVVRWLVENGQTLRDVEVPASWRGGASVPIDDGSRSALGAVVAALDDDGDGRVQLPSTVSLFEDGVVIRQRPDVELAIDGDRVELALALGLTRRGYKVIRDIDLEPTGDAAADAWLERATDALSRAMPPFRSQKKEGLVAGEAIGTCVPALITSAEPAPGTAPDDAAASA